MFLFPNKTVRLVLLYLPFGALVAALLASEQVTIVRSSFSAKIGSIEKGFFIFSFIQTASRQNLLLFKSCCRGSHSHSIDSYIAMANPFDQFATDFQAALPPGAPGAPPEAAPPAFGAPPPAAAPFANQPPMNGPYGAAAEQQAVQQPMANPYGAPEQAPPPPPPPSAYGATPPQAQPQQLGGGAGNPYGAPPPPQEQPPQPAASVGSADPFAAYGAPPSPGGQPMQQPPAAAPDANPFGVAPPSPVGQREVQQPPVQPAGDSNPFGGAGAPEAPQQPAQQPPAAPDAGAYADPWGQPPPPGQQPAAQPYGQQPPASPNAGAAQQQQPPAQPYGQQPPAAPDAGAPAEAWGQPPPGQQQPAAQPYGQQQPPVPPVNDPNAAGGALVASQQQSNPYGAPAAAYGAPPPTQPYGVPPPTGDPGALVPSAQQSNPYAQQPPAQPGYGAPAYGQQPGYGAPPPPPVDPFSVFESQQKAPEPAPAPEAAAPAGPDPTASDDEFWGSFGTNNAEAVSKIAPAPGGDSNEPKVEEEKKGDEGLPPGGEWYDARIFTPTLGVMFFKPQELTDSLFLNTDKDTVDALGERPVVAFIVEGSSARSAGVELGHVLLKVNGVDVRSPKEASRLIKEGPRPLPLLFYVPNTDVVIAEGEHMVKYDTRETTAPNSAKDWKPKYVVIGGIIAQPWMMNMYRSKVS